MSSPLSSKLTEGIRVNVRTVYVQDESSPKHQYFVFAYQVEIINESDHVVQLREREWQIIDGHGQRRRVQGQGVVGQQPLLAPGESHTYVSGCHFTTPIGSMHGTYLMERQQDGLRFPVEIPAFTMVVPHLQN
ncbi:MAG: Co2+/Mg2+ efflux protein ApaG [Bacteroidetes bacterium]|nr:MAG: Co2+/Mg2+ efflux protein ApaG [Bacteroidota bacterium]